MSEHAQSISLTPIRDEMIETILSLNNANTPHVNALDRDRLEALIAMSDVDLAAIDDSDAVQGFALVFMPGRNYDSLNYRWFESRFEQFLYLDRIVVLPNARRMGVGRSLYDVVFQAAKTARAERVCCEVNLDPPNPGSIRFHEQLGFQGIGEQSTEEGQKRVLLMERRIQSELPK